MVAYVTAYWLLFVSYTEQKYVLYLIKENTERQMKPSSEQQVNKQQATL